MSSSSSVKGELATKIIMCVLYGVRTEARRVIHYAFQDTSFDGDGNSHDVQTSKHTCRTVLQPYMFIHLQMPYILNASAHNFTLHLLQSVPYFAFSRTSQMSNVSINTHSSWDSNTRSKVRETEA
jgi:hypothetical protein